jgi:hypothetical protein
MSKIEVNTVDVQSGSTLTLGSCGKTVTLATGATQSGFGRTGTVDWCTTAKTSPLTAVSGKGYMINTCGGAVTVTLPSSPTAGDIVSIADYKSTWGVACKAVTLNRGGSKINGGCDNATLNTTGQSVTMVYIDGTQGWKSVQDSTSDVSGVSYISASGGNSCGTSGNYKWHKFTADGTFTVSSVGSGTPSETNQVSYIVVAGGGSGGAASANGAGGGGAGGFREGKNSNDPYTASPLDATSALTVTAQGYPITVGGGASAPPGPSADGSAGSNSIFSSITSAGGGGGGRHHEVGLAGGSGGGGGGGNASGEAGGAGNTPPTPVAQGTAGGTGGSPSPDRQGAGGGGATVVGTTAVPGAAGPGGTGATTSINATPTAYSGGGGGGGSVDTPGASGSGGTGGGGAGGSTPGTNTGTAGTANTGGGGGAGANCNPGGAGGKGVVIVRYRYQ